MPDGRACGIERMSIFRLPLFDCRKPPLERDWIASEAIESAEGLVKPQGRSRLFAGPLVDRFPKRVGDGLHAAIARMAGNASVFNRALATGGVGRIAP